MTTTKQTPSRIAFKSDTSENWAKAKNFIPLKGEPIHYSDLNKIKIGDGKTKVRDLPFAGQPRPSENVAYKLSDDGTYAICIGRNGFADTLLVIASEYQDRPVTHIGSNAFNNFDYQFPDIVNVILPNTITHIDDGAFCNCRIKQINIPDSVIYIGQMTFFQNQFTNITIPNGVTRIGNGAFIGCRNLVNVTIPDSVTNIGENAFYSCESLESITIPNSVISIGSSAFVNCEGLTIYCEAESKPEGWDNNWNVSGRPVIWGAALDILAVNDKLIEVQSQTIMGSEGLSYELSEDGTYAICTGIGTCSETDIVIADTYKGKPVASIGYAAFKSCFNLTSITIPDSVTLLGGWAFTRCSNLMSIVIPDSVEGIGEWAFNGCTSLTSIEIPDSVTNIGYNAFQNCTSLESIIIPDNVISIGSEAFAGCPNLTIYCEIESKPEGWNDSWNYSNRPVVWGAVLNIPAINEKISQVNSAIETLQNELGAIESALDLIIAIQEGLINGGEEEEEELITFTYTTISGDTFTLNAVNDQTWGEWCESEYNTIGAFVNSEQHNSIYVDEIAQIRRYWSEEGEEDYRYEDCYDITPIIANATYQRHG